MGLLVCATLACAGEPARAPATGKPTNATSSAPQWETDAVVRLGMDNIRKLMLAEQSAIQEDRLTAQDYQRLAQAIDQHLLTMARNRQLAPAAQAALDKVVLSDLNHSLNLMRTGTKVGLQRTGALGVQQSLRHYGTYFQHPGWR